MQFLISAILSGILYTSTPAVECEAPVITEANGISTESIYVAWFLFGGEPGTLFSIEVVEHPNLPTGIPTFDNIPDESFTINELNPGTEYDIYVRAVCLEGPSEWQGPLIARTHIDNDDPCAVAFNLPDNNCPGYTAYLIQADEDPQLRLGSDIFVKSVDLVVEHPWMADLDIQLRSPSGVTVSLARDRGVGVKDIGNPADTTCSETLNLTMAACQALDSISDQQTGEFLPEESLFDFHDDSPAFGTWELRICDKASDDIGTLHYVRINFTTEVCDLPPSVYLTGVLDTLATIAGIDDEICDTLYIEAIDAESGDTLVYIIPCDEDEMILNNLFPGISYVFSAYKRCGDTFSKRSCAGEFTTTCDYISLWSDFESTPLCMPICDATCELFDTLWSNSESDDANWIAFKGNTPTEFTGPSGDRFGAGQYLYVETTTSTCQSGAKSILETRCMMLRGSAEGCDMSFWYHMYGESVGTLTLEVSVDGGTLWDTLWEVTGDQGNSWHPAEVNLLPYDDTLARLRFVVQTDTGFMGDIAIDDIAFFGSSTGNDIEKCFYADSDDDGFGDLNSTICICALAPPPGFTIDTLDCDDTNPEISPDAEERPCNLIDDNCNGEVDEGINPDPVDYMLILLEDAFCKGIDNGKIEIAATGGLEPYTYSWNNGADTSALLNLSPGIYQCTVTDANGCIAITEEFEIEGVIKVNYYIIAVGDPSCIGKHDGFISGIVQGGTPPYTFAWNSGHSTRDINGLGEGVYQVTVTDSQGCFDISNEVELIAPASFTANVLEINHVDCSGGGDGSIRIAASNGAIPEVEYLWNTGDTTALITDLGSGSYMCTLTDSLGCMFIAGPYLINEPSDLEVQIVSAVAPQCYDGLDGYIDLSVNGGTAPYFFSWAHGPFTEDISDLMPGNYQVTVSDVHSCDTVIEISLVAPDTLHVQLDTILPNQCPADSLGVISISGSGGSLPYRYDWSYGNSDSSTLTGLPTGQYSVTLSDASGCKAILRDLDIVATNEPLIISIDSFEHVMCNSDSSGLIFASVSGGNAPYQFNWSAGIVQPSDDSLDILKQIPAGSYDVTITDANGCTGVSEIIEIIQPMRIQFSLQGIIHNPCYGDSVGSLDIRISGGTPPYRYLWSSGDTTEDLNSLAAGSYQLFVTDSLGCEMQTPEFEIIQPDSLDAEIIIVDETEMMANGRIELFPSGGTPPYTFKWDTTGGGAMTTYLEGLSAGSYTVTLTDDMGCGKVFHIELERITSTSEPTNGQIKVYPNPADEWLIVEIPFAQHSITLYAADGRKFSVSDVTPLSQHVARIDVRLVPSGMYIVRIEDRAARVLILH